MGTKPIRKQMSTIASGNKRFKEKSLRHLSGVINFLEEGTAEQRP